MTSDAPSLSSGVRTLDSGSSGAVGTSDGPDADVGWICGLLQAGDSFYPTGGYAHSFGLEGLVQLGAVRDLATLRAFVFASVLPSLRQSELPLAAHAWRALSACDWPEVGELCRLSASLKTAREARQATEQIGRQRAELVASLHASPLAREFLERAAVGKWPHSTAVSAALEGLALRAPLPSILAALAYSSLTGVVAAAMKLLRVGQNGCQRVVRDGLTEVPVIVRGALEVPRDQIGWFNPWLDIAAARHERAEARLFIS